MVQKGGIHNVNNRFLGGSCNGHVFRACRATALIALR